MSAMTSIYLDGHHHSDITSIIHVGGCMTSVKKPEQEDVKIATFEHLFELTVRRPKNPLAQKARAWLLGSLG